MSSHLSVFPAIVTLSRQLQAFLSGRNNYPVSEELFCLLEAFKTPYDMPPTSDLPLSFKTRLHTSLACSASYPSHWTTDSILYGRAVERFLQAAQNLGSQALIHRPALLPSTYNPEPSNSSLLFTPPLNIFEPSILNIELTQQIKYSDGDTSAMSYAQETPDPSNGFTQGQEQRLN